MMVKTYNHITPIYLLETRNVQHLKILFATDFNFCCFFLFSIESKKANSKLELVPHAPQHYKGLSNRA